MRIDGKAISAQIAVESNSRFWLLKIGFNEEYAKCSPGTLLIHESLCYAIANGLRSYEFLGAADQWTKRWTHRERSSLVVAVCPYTPGGLLALIGDIRRYAWRELMKQPARHLRKLYARRA
jgi:CelD/BcsL family acetyltransferase involved in cellulose biosynthesis